MMTELYKQAIARKKEPKTGSYTTYLFDKGLDKILKKVGEEETEGFTNCSKEEMSPLLAARTSASSSPGSTLRDWMASICAGFTDFAALGPFILLLRRQNLCS